MTNKLPVLDGAPSGRPHDWQLNRIMELKPSVEEVIRPAVWKNTSVRHLAPRDQKDRGTCVGQSTAYCYDIFYIILTGDIPTPEDKAQYKKDIIDSLGTLHDVLYPQSASAEQFYQISRKIGNVTYPAGSEIRFAARAWKDYGMNLESQWHTDKNGTMVWVGEPRQTTDGGLNPTDASNFAMNHKAEGWALVGDAYGNATFDQICDAIYLKGFVLSGIPVYENYTVMEGGDGSFPEPRGAIAGYHAMCMYGYDENRIYLLHSWGNFCSMYGSVSKEYINHSIDSSVYLVVMDSEDVKIARGHYHSLTVTVKDGTTMAGIPADVNVNGVIVGKSPQKFATEPGQVYTIDTKMDGYYSCTQQVTADDSDKEITVALNPIPIVQESFWKRIVDLIYNAIKRIFKGGN